MPFSNPKTKERLKIFLLLLAVWSIALIFWLALIFFGKLTGIGAGHGNIERDTPPHDDYSPYYGWH